MRAVLPTPLAPAVVCRRLRRCQEVRVKRHKFFNSVPKNTSPVQFQCRQHRHPLVRRILTTNMSSLCSVLYGLNFERAWSCVCGSCIRCSMTRPLFHLVFVFFSRPCTLRFVVASGGSASCAVTENSALTFTTRCCSARCPFVLLGRNERFEVLLLVYFHEIPFFAFGLSGAAAGMLQAVSGLVLQAVS